jgi:hypothetical protein
MAPQRGRRELSGTTSAQNLMTLQSDGICGVGGAVFRSKWLISMGWNVIFRRLSGEQIDHVGD